MKRLILLIIFFSMLFSNQIPDTSNLHLTSNEINVLKSLSPKILKTMASDSLVLTISTSYQWHDYQWNLYNRGKYTYDGNANAIERLFQRWTNNTWINNGKWSHKYNSDGKVIELKRQEWEDEEWVNSSLYQYEWNSDGAITERLYQHWRNGTWTNNSISTYIYESGNIIEFIRQTWTNNAWVNSIHDECSYDQNNNQLESIQQRWENDTWVNYYRTQSIYDINNNRIEWIHYNWIDNNWKENSRRIESYDINSNMIEQIYQNCEVEDTSWLNVSRSLKSYDNNNNIIEDITQRWIENDWENKDLSTYMYNAKGYNAQVINKYWENNNWVNDNIRQYTYDSENNIIERLYQNWAENTWVNDRKTINQYQLVQLAPTISKVFPGDTNNDGIVNEYDIIPLGYYFLYTGESRQNVSFWWEAQEISSWETYPANYADCNGDGIVDEKDIMGIGVNWGNTHDSSLQKIDIEQSEIIKHKGTFYKLYKSIENSRGIHIEAIKKLLEEKIGIIPTSPVLHNNFPNPFNPSTLICFSLPRSMIVDLKIYNVKGQLEKSLINKKSFDSGLHKISFNGEVFKSGIYFYVLETPETKLKGKMCLIK